MTYRNWNISPNTNEWGYHEAYNLNDCDAPMIFDKNIDVIKEEIDEIETEALQNKITRLINPGQCPVSVLSKTT
jgi:hypothetical protein